MTRQHEAVERLALGRQQRLECRRHDAVRDQHREVLRQLSGQRGRGGAGGGFEADREEDDLLLRHLRRELDRVVDAVDHPDVGALGARLEQADARRHPDDVAEGGQNHLLLGRQPSRHVEIRRGTDTDRAAGAGDQAHPLRQEVAQAELAERVLVRAADMHQPQLPPGIELGDGLGQPAYGRSVAVLGEDGLRGHHDSSSMPASASSSKVSLALASSRIWMA
ncbi:MAG: hypothetical protein QM765_14230 [Myxococcales bacterium]